MKEFAVAMIIALIILVPFGYFTKKADTANDKIILDYIIKHKCARTGEFAGKNATPIYQCDNGKWLGSEFHSLAKQENENSS